MAEGFESHEELYGEHEENLTRPIDMGEVSDDISGFMEDDSVMPMSEEPLEEDLGGDEVSEPEPELEPEPEPEETVVPPSKVKSTSVLKKTRRKNNMKYGLKEVADVIFFDTKSKRPIIVFDT